MLMISRCPSVSSLSWSSILTFSSVYLGFTSKILSAWNDHRHWQALPQVLPSMLNAGWWVMQYLIMIYVKVRHRVKWSIENTMLVLHNIIGKMYFHELKCIIVLWSRNFTPAHTLRRIQGTALREYLYLVFLCSKIHNSEKVDTNSASRDGQINNMWNIHWTEYYLVFKRKKIVLCTYRQMYSEFIIPCGTSHHKRTNKEFLKKVKEKWN